MREIILDLRASEKGEEIHNYLKSKLEFPDYYGANLDALYDMLTDICQDISITMVFAEEIESPGYLDCKRIREVFLDAARENNHIRLIDKAD